MPEIENLRYAAHDCMKKSDEARFQRSGDFLTD
jgi:hypothetical protein